MEHEQERQQKEGEAEPASGSANLEGPVLPALRKLTIDGNIPPILSLRTRSRRPHTGVEGAALHCFLPAIEAEEENGVEDTLACDDGGQMAMQATLDILEPRNRRKAMESPEWDKWRNLEEKQEMRKFPYREVAGALIMWTATMTRPDIACAVRAVARFCENPGPAHKKAMMEILQYFLHTKEWGITYGGQG